jgi:antitoxin (DNA-binding transcriptional repressor) of toxin-antitoxin stability system
MTTITVRDVRLHWPRAEQKLAAGGELVVTRDGKPVARILPFRSGERKRRRFQSAEHLRWLAAFWKRKSRGPSTGEWLAKDRDE